jgi:hypothetical protein
VPLKVGGIDGIGDLPGAPRPAWTRRLRKTAIVDFDAIHESDILECFLVVEYTLPSRNGRDSAYARRLGCRSTQQDFSHGLQA